MKIDLHLCALKKIVIAAGGKWVGIQPSMTDDEHTLVLFNSEKTGSTLALPDNEFFTVQAVQDKIRLSDREFANAPVHIPRGSLNDIVQELEGIAAALKIYMENK
jgi:hypothetical protein